MSGATLNFGGRLSAVAGQVESLLETLLAEQERLLEGAGSGRLMAAMRHAVLGGGKRLRPFLIVETARLLGAEGEGALRAGCAVELLHCYSLVHDDLPSMDDDDLRRGRPTVHRAFDEATAILAGDALQTLAFEVMVDARTHPDGALRAELAFGLARASGLAGMVGGQMLDLEAEGRWGGAEPGKAEVRRLQAMKTGALLAFSVQAGAIVGRADPVARESLLAFGRALGAAFQVADDILDRVASPEQLGKGTGKDKDKGKATLVDVLGLEGARAESKRLVAEAQAALSGFGRAADVLRQAARFTAERQA
jgi:farnesyl diphosphate synthase